MSVDVEAIRRAMVAATVVVTSREGAEQSTVTLTFPVDGVPRSGEVADAVFQVVRK